MAQPGRPKRRNKIGGGAYLSQMANQSQQNSQSQSQFRQLKEDIAQVHDEADLVSFRNDALNRYITNHDYIDNITAKPIHTSKIIPPTVFPVSQKSDERKPEELYFGDLEYMRKKVHELINELKQEKDKGIEQPGFTEEYLFQSNSVQRLAELQSQVQDEKSLEELEAELNNVLDTYSNKYNKKFKCISSVTQYSVPVDKISNIQVNEAPKNYNPRSINSLINMNSNIANDNVNSVPNSSEMNNPSLSDQNIQQDQFGIDSGIFMDQFASNNTNPVDFQADSGISNNFTMQVMNQPNSSEGNGETVNDDKTTSDRNMIDDEISDLFNDNNQEPVLDSNPVDDPMGELINFEGNEDDDIMPSNSFNQEFLS